MTFMRLRTMADGQSAGPAAATAGTPGPDRAGPGRAGLRKVGLRGTSLGALLRRHWLLAVLLAAGLVLRVLAQVAYRPALLYIDSIKYLYIANGADPVGYRVLLKPLLVIGNLDLVAAVQHLLGLGMAVALYLLMRRRSVPRWLAALATAPILLDGYQLQNEQTIMPDTLFEALIVTGLVILLWQPKPRLPMIIGGGLAPGAPAPRAPIPPSPPPSSSCWSASQAGPPSSSKAPRWPPPSPCPSSPTAPCHSRKTGTSGWPTPEPPISMGGSCSRRTARRSASPRTSRPCARSASRRSSLASTAWSTTTCRRCGSTCHRSARASRESSPTSTAGWRCRTRWVSRPLSVRTP